MSQVALFQPTHFSFGKFKIRYTGGGICMKVALVSIFGIYFSETQSIIKSQKTDATFGEISKIVASMWDGLGENEKTVSQIFKTTDFYKAGIYILGISG